MGDKKGIESPVRVGRGEGVTLEEGEGESRRVSAKWTMTSTNHSSTVHAAYHWPVGGTGMYSSP